MAFLHQCRCLYEKKNGLAWHVLDNRLDPIFTCPDHFCHLSIRPTQNFLGLLITDCMCSLQKRNFQPRHSTLTPPRSNNFFFKISDEMAPYDSDDSLDDDQDYTETDVLLGYASKDSNDGETISKLGGRPVCFSTQYLLLPPAIQKTTLPTNTFAFCLFFRTGSIPLNFLPTPTSNAPRAPPHSPSSSNSTPSSQSASPATRGVSTSLHAAKSHAGARKAVCVPCAPRACRRTR